MEFTATPSEMLKEYLDEHRSGIPEENSKKRDRHEYEDGYSDLQLKGPSYEPAPVPVETEEHEMVTQDVPSETPATNSIKLGEMHEMVMMEGPSNKSDSSPEDRKDSKQEAQVSIKDFAVPGPSSSAAARSSIDAWVQDLNTAFESQGENDTISDLSFTTAQPFPQAHLNNGRPSLFGGDISAVGTNDSMSTVKPLNRTTMSDLASKRFNAHLSPHDSVSQVGLGNSSTGIRRSPVPTNPGQPPYRKIPFVNPNSPISSKPASRVSRNSQPESQSHSLTLSRPPPNIITRQPSPPARLDMTTIRAEMATHTAATDAADTLRTAARKRQTEIETMSA